MEDTVFTSSVCTDCAMYIANGETPDLESRGGATVAQWVAEFDRIALGGRWTLELGEYAGESFSMSGCHSCSSGLGGMRFNAVWDRE